MLVCLCVCVCYSLFLSNLWLHTKINENKHWERCKHCALAVVRRSKKCSPRCRPPSWGRRTAKIWSVGDGLHLFDGLPLPTNRVGEDRCPQFRVIVVTDLQTNKQTHRQDRLQYTLSLSLVHSVMMTYRMTMKMMTTQQPPPPLVFV